MNTPNFKLAEMPLRKKCIVKCIQGGTLDKRRLYDLGFFEGSSIEPLYESHGGGTVAYLVKGTIIALRKEDAENIIIQTSSGEAAGNGK